MTEQDAVDALAEALVAQYREFPDGVLKGGYDAPGLVKLLAQSGWHLQRVPDAFPTGCICPEEGVYGHSDNCLQRVPDAAREGPTFPEMVMQVNDTLAAEVASLEARAVRAEHNMLEAGRQVAVLREALQDVVGTESGWYSDHPENHCTIENECAAGHVQRVLRDTEEWADAHPERCLYRMALERWRDEFDPNSKRGVPEYVTALQRVPDAREDVVEQAVDALRGSVGTTDLAIKAIVERDDKIASLEAQVAVLLTSARGMADDLQAAWEQLCDAARDKNDEELHRAIGRLGIGAGNAWKALSLTEKDGTE